MVSMKIRYGVPPFFQIEEEIPSLFEVIDTFDPLRLEWPQKKARRLRQLLKTHATRKKQIEISGRLDTHVT